MTTLKRSLTSEAMLGHVTTAEGKSVRGDDGPDAPFIDDHAVQRRRQLSIHSEMALD